jgi:hypothetical protein
MVKSLGFLSEMGAYMVAGAVSPQAAGALIFADTYESSLREAHNNGLEGAPAEINASIHGLVMSSLAHILPNVGKAAGKFEVSANTLQKILQASTIEEGKALLKKDISKFILENAGRNISQGVKTQAEFLALGVAGAFVNSITNQLAGSELNTGIDVAHSMKDALAMTALNTVLGAGKGAMLYRNIKKPEIRTAYLNAAINGNYNIAIGALDNLVDMHKGDAGVAEFAEKMKADIMQTIGIKPREGFTPEQNVQSAKLYVDIKKLEAQKEGLKDSPNPIYEKVIDKQIADKENQLAEIANNPKKAEAETAAEMKELVPEESLNPAEVATQEEVNSVTLGDVVDKQIIYKGKKAQLLQDGQSLVVKIDGEPLEYELVNVDKIIN